MTSHLGFRVRSVKSELYNCEEEQLVELMRSEMVELQKIEKVGSDC